MAFSGPHVTAFDTLGSYRVFWCPNGARSEADLGLVVRLPKMIVAQLIEVLKGLPPEARVRLEASFDGMCGSGFLAEVVLIGPDDALGELIPEGAVVLRDEEMARP